MQCFLDTFKTIRYDVKERETYVVYRQESCFGCLNTLAIFYIMFNLLFSIYLNIRKLLDDGVVGDFWSQQMVTKTWSLPKGQLLQLLKLYSSNHPTHLYKYLLWHHSSTISYRKFSLKKPVNIRSYRISLNNVRVH